METDREKMLLRVRKLLALGNSTTSQEEAAQAIGMAQKIMAEHQISEAMLPLAGVPDEPIRRWEEPLDVAGNKMVRWRGQLAVSIARCHGCIVWSMGHGRLGIIGRATDTNTVRYLFAFCAREVERLSAVYAGNGKTWLNNYRYGVVDAIRIKLDEANVSARAAMTKEHGASASMAIVRIDTKAAEVVAWQKENFKLTKAKPITSRGDRSARERGRSDGAAINLGSGQGLERGARGEIGGGSR